MSGRPLRGRLISGAVLALAVAVTGVSAVRLERRGTAGLQEQELLYLPNGKHLKVASLGHASLMADIVYLWAIQYYSNYQRTDRYRFVQHIFGDVIAELDPNYVDPYWIGALILTTEAQDLEGGLALLEQGMDANPDAWILPYLAAWECYRVEDFVRAENYFARAAQIPDAPAAMLRLRAGMRGKQGDLRASIDLWQGVVDDPRSDEISRQIASRQIRDLTVQADIADHGEVDRSVSERIRSRARIARRAGRARLPSLGSRGSRRGGVPTR